MLSSPSTVTMGTLRSISVMVLVLASGSASMSYVILSTSAFMRGRDASTTSSARALSAAFVSTLPRSTLLCAASNSNVRMAGILPTTVNVARYFPAAFMPTLNLPFSSVTSTFTGCLLGFAMSKTRIVAYGSLSLLTESTKTPLTEYAATVCAHALQFAINAIAKAPNRQ